MNASIERLASARARVNTAVARLRKHLDTSDDAICAEEITLSDRLRLEELMAEVDVEKLAYEIEWEQHMEELREANRAAERELIRESKDRREAAEKRHAELLEQQKEIQASQAKSQHAQAEWTRGLVVAQYVLCAVTLAYVIVALVRLFARG